MKQIEIQILNTESLGQNNKLMNLCAKLTQHGHEIHDMSELLQLYTDISDPLKLGLVSLPHPTLQKFVTISVAIVGASRRFLAQITRHQNEVKFMSASLQYSDFSDTASYVVPYNILTADLDIQNLYHSAIQQSLISYTQLTDQLSDHDTSSYVTPQALRNILIISATPYQWKHMIGQRICRRNTDETRIVMLKIWSELYKLDPILFGIKTTGAFCQQGTCLEGKMSCGNILNAGPDNILHEDYSRLFEDNE